MNQTNIGQRIKEKREQNGLSLQDVANSLDVNRSSVMRWENGETNRIKLPMVEKLAQILKTTPKYLMGYEEQDSDFVINRSCSSEDACLLPVLKSVCCVERLFDEKSILRYEVADASYKDDFYFYMTASRNSMAPQIDDGDRILIRKQSYLKNGEIGVFLIDEHEVLIRVFNQTNGIELHAFNPYFPVVFFEQGELERVQIIGKVIESRKQW